MRLENVGKNGCPDGQCPYCKAYLEVESTYEEHDANVQGVQDCPECGKPVEVTTTVVHAIHKPGMR